MKIQLKGLAITTAVLLVISLTFNIVLAVSGATYDPGSDQDPLVSKSYVDTSVNGISGTLEQLQNQYNTLQSAYNTLKSSNDDLAARVAAQDLSIKSLQDALKAAGTKPSGGSSNQPSDNSSNGNGNAGGTSSGTTLGKGVSNAANLNVRSQASTTSTSIAKLAKGETVTVISKSGDWYKIKTSTGKTGFVMAKYITMKN